MAPLVALKYNTWLMLTEKDADVIIQRQINNWQLNITKPKEWEKDLRWAKAMDSIMAVKKYIKETYNKDIQFKQFKSDDSKTLNELLDLWYMVTLGIMIDIDFTKDVADWKIDEKNYFNFTNWKKLWHFTNLARWKGRFTEWCEKLEDYNKNFIYDQYAFNKLKREWVYSNIDFKQLPIISQQYYYCFYI